MPGIVRLSQSGQFASFRVVFASVDSRALTCLYCCAICLDGVAHPPGNPLPLYGSVRSVLQRSSVRPLLLEPAEQVLLGERVDHVQGLFGDRYVVGDDVSDSTRPSDRNRACEGAAMGLRRRAVDHRAAGKLRELGVARGRPRRRRDGHYHARRRHAPKLCASS